MSKLKNSLKNLNFKHLYIIYLVLLGVSYLYVHNVLTNGRIELEDSKKESKSEDSTPIVVYAALEQNSKVSSFRYRLTDQDTVSELFESARDDKNLLFEVTWYRSGQVIDSVNNQSNNDKFKWRVYKQKDDSITDITDSMDETHLEEDYTYILRYVPVDSIQS